MEYYNFPLPPDYQEKTEWVFGRLIYPAIVDYPRWTMDYPRSDRHFSAALRRLTRVQRAFGGTAHQPGRRRRCV